MGTSVLLQRKLSLISRKHDIEYKLMQCTDDLYDHQAYASAIADGGVSTSNLMALPNSVFGRGLQYVQASSMYANASTQEKFAQLQATGGLNSLYSSGMSPEQQMQMQQQIIQTLHAQALEAFKKQETMLLHQKEKQIEHKKAGLETQLAQVEAELQSVDKRLGQEAQNSVPKFGV